MLLAGTVPRRSHVTGRRHRDVGQGSGWAEEKRLGTAPGQVVTGSCLDTARSGWASLRATVRGPRREPTTPSRLMVFCLDLQLCSAR
jgi:hypothetical protein